MTSDEAEIESITGSHRAGGMFPIDARWLGLEDLRSL